MAVTLSFLNRFSNFFSLTYSAVNLQHGDNYRSHHTLNVSLHYLGKVKSSDLPLIMVYIAPTLAYVYNKKDVARRRAARCLSLRSVAGVNAT